MINWSDLEPGKPLVPDKMTGPELILAGKGCRIVVKSIADEERRDFELAQRVYRMVGLLLESGADGFQLTQAEGYGAIRSTTADAAYYVRGANSPEVLGTIGMAIVKAPEPLRTQLKDLGVYALMEW